MGVKTDWNIIISDLVFNGAPVSTFKSTWYCGKLTSTDLEPVIVSQSEPRTALRSVIHRLICPQQVNATHTWASSFPAQYGNPYYDLGEWQTCDKLQDQEYYNLENARKEDVFEKAPKQPRLASCQIFRDVHQQSQDKLKEFVVHHRLMGVEHFWIYLNQEWNMTGLPRADDITYVPYDFTKWHVPGRRKANQPFQVPMQHHCLFKMKEYGYDWVVTTDLDEYIDVTNQNSTNLIDFLEKYFDPHIINSLIMRSVPFGANLTEPNTELVTDYVYRNRLTKMDEFQGGREKHIYSVHNAEYVGVHYLYGKSATPLVPSTQAYVKHYKLPTKGVFQTAQNMILKDDNFSLRYRNEIRAGILKW